MSILKNIWNTFFGGSKKEDKFSKGGDIFKPEMEVVYKKTEDEVENGRTYTENELGEEHNPQTCNEVQEQNEVQESVDLIHSLEFSKLKQKRSYKKKEVGFVMTKEQWVLQYLLKYGSIDKRTCDEKFGLKRLDNLICDLRKQGLNIKSETIELHNESGVKTQVSNYILVKSDGTN